MQKHIRKFILLCLQVLCLISFSTSSYANELSLAKPFTVELTTQGKSYLWVKFKIAEDYHLYQNKISIVNTKQSHVIMDAPVLPDPIIIPNIDADKTKVYEKSAVIQVPVKNYADGKLQVQINYQGCKGTTLCMPEEQNIYNVDFNSGNVSLVEPQVTQIGTTPSNPTNKLLDINANISQVQDYFNQSIIWVIVGFFVLGLLIAFTPCVFPMLPILITLISGKNISHKRSFILAVGYILGSATIYAITGVIAASFGLSISTFFQAAWLSIVLAIVFGLFAVSLFGWYNIQISNSVQIKINQRINKIQNGTILSAFIIGGLSTLILSPCVTAPLAGALVYIGTTGNLILGASALFALGIGSGIPLLVIALFGKKALPKSGNWMNISKQILGLMMLAMAFYMVNKVLIGYEDVFLIIWIFIGVLVFANNSKVFHNPKYRNTIVTVLVIIGLFAYNYTSKFKMQQVDEKFTVVTTVNELNQQLAAAKLNHQAVVLDFYASWCSACRELDLRTFSNAEVQTSLAKYKLIRVDSTNNTYDIQSIQRTYGITALPSLVMINKDGSIANDLQVFGYINAKQMLAHLDQFNKIQEKYNCQNGMLC